MQINRSAELSEAPPAPVPLVLIDEKDPTIARDSAVPGGDPSTPLSVGAPRVLLVDDNQKTLARAKSVLSASCLVVGTMSNGQAALEAVESLNPDVIVLDMSMPGMSGLEVAQRLRATGARARIVFLTVHDEEELILAARNAGALGYVVKPRLVSDLELAIREACAGRPFQSPVR